MVNPRLAKRIGTNLRKRRIELELTQEKLAELSGLHRTYIGALERGEKSITVEMLEKILTALDLTFIEFFTLLED